MYSSGRRGFIEVRTLVALFITMSLLPLIISVFKFSADLDFNYNLVNNELALMDLRRVLLIAYDMKIADDELNFIYHNDHYKLSMVNNKLLLQPGTQIYLSDIEDISFSTKNGCIYITYLTKDKREYERNIGKEKGIYLDDFLDNNDELSEFDNSDE